MARVPAAAVGAAVAVGVTLLACGAHAWEYDAQQQKLHLTVGTYNTPPFSFPTLLPLVMESSTDEDWYAVAGGIDGAKWDGFVWRLWEVITSDLSSVDAGLPKLTIHISVVNATRGGVETPITSGTELVAAVADPDSGVDIGLGSVTKTDEREHDVDFTHGYYRAGQKVLVLNKASFWLQVLDVMKTIVLNPLLGRTLLLMLAIGCTFGFLAHVTEWWYIDSKMEQLERLKTDPQRLAERHDDDRDPTVAFGFDPQYAWWHFCCCSRRRILRDTNRDGRVDDLDEAHYDFSRCTCCSRAIKPGEHVITPRGHKRIIVKYGDPTGWIWLSPPLKALWFAQLWAFAILLNQDAPAVQGKLSRTLKACLAFSALFVFGLLTASLTVTVATTNAGNSITSLDDLAAGHLRYACGISGSTACSFMANDKLTRLLVAQANWEPSQRWQQHVMESGNVEDAAALLVAGTVHAVVWDSPSLLEWQKTATTDTLVFGRTSNDEAFTVEDYGIVLPTGAHAISLTTNASTFNGNVTLRELLNRAIVEPANAPAFFAIEDAYIPGANSIQTTGTDSSVLSALFTSVVMMVIGISTLIVCGVYQDRCYPTHKWWLTSVFKCKCCSDRCCKEERARVRKQFGSSAAIDGDGGVGGAAAGAARVGASTSNRAEAQLTARARAEQAVRGFPHATEDRHDLAIPDDQLVWTTLSVLRAVQREMHDMRSDMQALKDERAGATDARETEGSAEGSNGGTATEPRQRGPAAGAAATSEAIAAAVVDVRTSPRGK